MQQTSLYKIGKNELGHDDLQSLNKFSPLDRGLQYGDGIFETILVFERKPIFLDIHLRRLITSLKRINIPFEIPIKRLVEFVEEDLMDSGEKTASLKIIVTRGENISDFSLNQKCSPHLIIQISPYEIPIEIPSLKLIIAAERRNELSRLSSLKTLNYLSNLSARQEAIMRKADDAVLLNTKDQVAECTTSNLFIVKDGALFTPPLNVGILPGITRNRVLTIANSLKINEYSKILKTNDLETADEIFLTSSLRGIASVKSLNAIPLPGSDGKITKLIAQKYWEEIRLEV